jgi:hypothetical protein
MALGLTYRKQSRRNWRNKKEKGGEKRVWREING